MGKLEAQLVEALGNDLVLGGDGLDVLPETRLLGQGTADEVGQLAQLFLRQPDILRVLVEAGLQLLNLLFEDLQVVVDELVDLLGLARRAERQGQAQQDDEPGP